MIRAFEQVQFKNSKITLEFSRSDLRRLIRTGMYDVDLRKRHDSVESSDGWQDLFVNPVLKLETSYIWFYDK